MKTHEAEAFLATANLANIACHEIGRLKRHRGILARALRIAKNQLRGALHLNRVHEITILNLQCRIGAAVRHERHLQEENDHLRNELVLERKASQTLLADMTRDLEAARSEAFLLAQLRQEMAA
jgi:hypothetical protein